jgi:tetratricopeptide (TPR) repeat protein
MSQGLCPSCGAAINLSAEQTEINCTYCQTLVRRPEAEAQFNELKISKYAGTLLIADTSREGGSYEEAVAFYNKIIEQEPTFADAWLNKGICMLQTSKIGDLKTTEAISSWKAAIKFAKHPDAMKKRVAKEIETTVGTFYTVLESHYKQFSTLDNSYSEHISRFLKLENALALALELDSSNPDICTTGINLCEAVISAATDAGTENAVGALMNKDWKGALNSAVGGFSAASAVRRPVEQLKLKYQRALAAIDPNFKAPDGPPTMPLNVGNTIELKEALVAPLCALADAFGPRIIIFRNSAAIQRLRWSKELVEIIKFFNLVTKPEDVLLFEPAANFLVTLNHIAWGTKKGPLLGFLTEEEKTVIARTAVVDVTYAYPKAIQEAQPPVVHHRNSFGVKEVSPIKTTHFKTYYNAILGGWGGSKHDRAETLVLFLKNWMSLPK